MASKVRQQPPWQAPPTPPPDTKLPPLKIYNSLTRTKTPFIPLDPRGRKVTWYCCGPTVYDAGHLGHARNYVSTDILRRIMRDYFGFDIQFVMNITDVDDKIILRARQQHLLAEFVKENSEPAKALPVTLKAFQAYTKKNVPSLSEGVTPEEYARLRSHGDGLQGEIPPEGAVVTDQQAKLKMHLKTLDAASAALLTAADNSDPITSEAFYASTSDVLLPYLDSLHGSAIKQDDYAIFTKLTQHWERHFKEDLRTLNCLPPTNLTRVSEFVPENVAFIKKIVEKGFGYVTSDGSVYFNISAFEARGNQYARLEPWNRNDNSLLADGEGSLTKQTTEKKSSSDFALWKASKPGEPSWPSPWGRGRPGWHIECSVMCSEVLGSQIDIHSGGVDLAFPHHDNELAQSEAYWTDGHKEHQHQWVNYFMHMGHLSIQGSKMSKSLKNFTTIREALGRGGGWTARGLRIVFLLGGWRDRIEVTDDVISSGKSWETTINKFFTNIKALIAEAAESEKAGKQVSQLFRKAEHELTADLDAARLAVHDALCDSFNTPLAMSIIADLVTKTNIYISTNQKTYLSIACIEDVARYITHLIDIFGLDASTTTDGGDRIGWSSASASSENKDGRSLDAQEVSLPYVRTLSKFRDNIRAIAIKQENPLKRELLELCDSVRDNDLTNLGIYLDDREGGQPALVKFVPKEELITAREQKAAEKAAAEKRKEEQKAEREKAEKEKTERGKLSPQEMFKTDEYSAWDEDGVPTKDRDGEEITKSRGKKLRKDWDRQKKFHESWLAGQKA